MQIGLGSFLLTILILLHQTCSATISKRQSAGRSSFTRYVEYAETPFQRPSYYSVPYRVPPNNELRYISNDMFAHLIREHVRHQQRVKLMHQSRRLNQQALFSTQEPILKGVSHITELRQTPFQRFSHDSNALTYEEKRRRWKEDLKKRMRANKQPARTIDEVNVVGTAGRYYITFNPFSNAYQVSRKLPSYVRKEDFEPEMRPDNLLPTIPQTTSTTTPAPIVQHATKVEEDIQQTIRIPSSPKKTRPKSNAPIRQILNLDYYDDEFEAPESENEQEIQTTQIPVTTSTSTTQRPTTTSRPQIVYPPVTTSTSTTQRPTTTSRPQIVYPPITTTVLSIPITTQRSSLFSSYEDDEEVNDEDDEDFTWFKPSHTNQRTTSSPASNDPFSIVAHNPQ